MSYEIPYFYSFLSSFLLQGQNYEKYLTIPNSFKGIIHKLSTPFTDDPIPYPWNGLASMSISVPLSLGNMGSQVAWDQHRNQPWLDWWCCILGIWIHRLASCTWNDWMPNTPQDRHSTQWTYGGRLSATLTILWSVDFFSTRQSSLIISSIYTPIQILDGI